MKKVVIELKEVPTSCFYCELSYAEHGVDSWTFECAALGCTCPVYGRCDDCPIKEVEVAE